jgi:diadenosine tetraphosphatase ApaH/serine/threonine PP2A family protein phosphatase
LKTALISDIHSNFEALTAVLADIEARKIEHVYFLGDLIGYGPAPEACIDVVSKRCSVHLIGNHDEAILNEAIDFNPIARGAIECQREKMKPGVLSPLSGRRRWSYLKSLEIIHRESGFTFVHGSPRDYIVEYVLPSDAFYAPDKIAEIMGMIDKVCFVGHSHMPGVMTGEPRFFTPKDLNGEYEFPEGRKVIVNIGSVGQPRDHDPRACYVEFDEKGCAWHRIEYDIKKTVEKIKAMSCLHERNGLRLLEGR